MRLYKQTQENNKDQTARILMHCRRMAYKYQV